MPETTAAEMAALTMHAEFTRDRFRTQVTRTAARLRDLADDIERAAGRIDSVPTPGVPSHVTIAGSIQHDVLWAVANMHLDQLATTAAEADQLTAQVKAATAQQG
ncbi:hypothetical protein BDK92_7198 [Micromonospora pisi]|uniref:PE family protein n=1 Tax=Micromonospora pisi TaxID=589240 RepID=A0A495JUQ2_9ACTN|nr:hypothetical protein [Micromonospora pisi]RKR92720.1 hypothetical protein BDK92_7198 [Micromonospora pisi]